MTPLDLFNRSISGEWKTAGTDTQYRIEVIPDVAGKKTQYVFFQPTGSQDDWKKNFDIWPIHGVHGGYWKRFTEARAQVLAEIDKGMKTVFAGYSMGAAIALLFYLSTDVPRRAILFACPRVLWLDTRGHERDKSLVRVSVRGDPVTRLPFAVLGYRHIGIEAKIGRKVFGYWPKYHQAAAYVEALAVLSDIHQV